jgi:RNA polymerase sigma-70 factor (ECF subfamily)
VPGEAGEGELPRVSAALGVSRGATGMSGLSARLRALLPAGDWAALDAWLDDAGPLAPTSEAALRVLAGHLGRVGPTGLPGLSGADLLLAAACVERQSAALAELDRRLVTEVRRALGGVDPAIDDVTQLVRERLLVGAPPRIAEYAGQGPLSAWLRAVALRTALNARRGGAREAPVSSPPDSPVSKDPELALLRERYRDAFRRAFADAVSKLSSRERTVLRLSVVDGLTLERIGAIYRKDASTISRWLDAARRALHEHTRAALQPHVPSGEFDSVLRAADSELNLSLSRLLDSSSAG